MKQLILIAALSTLTLTSCLSKKERDNIQARTSIAKGAVSSYYYRCGKVGKDTRLCKENVKAADSLNQVIDGE